MSYHYIPSYDPVMFGVAEARADEYWRIRHMPMDIPSRRIAVYQEMLHLKSLPYLGIEQRARLEELEVEYNRLRLCGDVRKYEE